VSAILSAGHGANAFGFVELFGIGVRYNTDDPSLPIQIDIYAAYPPHGSVPAIPPIALYAVIPVYPIPEPIPGPSVPEPAMGWLVAAALVWGLVRRRCACRPA
jgi:hypothetical protein